MRFRCTALLFAAVVVLIVAVTLAACSKKRSSTSDVVDKGRSIETAIKASAGGAAYSPTGAKLDIPSGALQSDTKVKISEPTDQKTASGSRVFRLEPSGLTFAKPAAFTIPYSDLEGKDPQFTVYISSVANKTENLGSEESNWQFANVVARDETLNTLTIELEHFTFVYVAIRVDQNAYLVMDIPAKYLQPGDLLFTLTNSGEAGEPVRPDWKPGHVGLFAGSSNDPNRVIEATPPKVKENTLGKFKTEHSHLYLGPRRPVSGFTASDRQKMVSFGEKELGQNYSLTGEGHISQGRTWSCVGLAEKALDSIGKGLLSDFQQATVSTPLELFRATIAVGDITVDVGEDIRIPVYGVMVDPQSPYRLLTYRGWYTDGGTTSFPLYNIDAVTRPPGSTFSGSANTALKYRFEWKPEAQHAGKSFQVQFLMKADIYVITGLFGSRTYLENVELSETLTINVRPLPTTPTAVTSRTSTPLPTASPTPSPTPARTPTPTPTLATPAFSVVPIRAEFNQAGQLTVYRAQVTYRGGPPPLNYSWSGPDCGPPNFPLSTEGSTGETNPLLDFTWRHPHPPCDQTTDHSNRTIRLVVQDAAFITTCTYQGAATGIGGACTTTRRQ